MINSKKFITLGATAIAGFTAMSSLAPMTALADVAKEGQTTVTYEGAPKPAEWGLAVPATVKLDKISSLEEHGGTHTLHYGNVKAAIVKEDGSNFSDTIKDRTFSISGKGTGTDGSLVFKDASNNVHTDFLYVSISGAQGDNEPTDLAASTWHAGDNKAFAVDLATKADGSNAKAEQWLQFGVNESKTGFDKNANYTETISWTATEKNA